MILLALEEHPEDMCLISFDALTESNCIPYHILQDEWKIGVTVTPAIPKEEVQSKHLIDFKVRFDQKDESHARAIWSRLNDFTFDAQLP
jgi:hypothetical protein